jgi:large subunit ribosomal protein L29
MIKAGDLRVMDEEALEDKLRELKETLFNLRFQHVTGQLDNPMKIKEARRDIARVCTVMTEREHAIHADAFAEAAAEPLQAAADRAELEADFEAEEDLEEEVAEERIGVVSESEEQLEEEVEEELKDI